MDKNSASAANVVSIKSREVLLAYVNLTLLLLCILRTTTTSLSIKYDVFHPSYMCASDISLICICTNHLSLLLPIFAR